MNKIKITSDIVFNPNTLKDITIIHLADVHFSVTTKISHLDAIKEKIYLNNPDYIVITGDLLDDPIITKNKIKIKNLLMFLTDLANFSKVIISLGNHDIFVEGDYKFFHNLNDLNNIYVLDNNTYKDDFIFMAGLTLPNEYYYNITGSESVSILLESLKVNKILKKIPTNVPRVCLIHSPINLSNKDVLNQLGVYDLLLSGHTHNGMVPDCLNKLFKNNSGIVSPKKELFPEIARGRIDKYVNNKNVAIIINGGVTKLSNKSGKILSKFNFFYNTSLNKIIITNKRMNKKLI